MPDTVGPRPVKKAQAAATACLHPPSRRECMWETILPYHRLTQSYYKSVTDSGFVLALGLSQYCLVLCRPMAAVETSFSGRSETKYKPRANAMLHMVLQKHASHLLLEEWLFSPAATGNDTLACLPTPQVKRSY